MIQQIRIEINIHLQDLLQCYVNFPTEAAVTTTFIYGREPDYEAQEALCYARSICLIMDAMPVFAEDTQGGGDNSVTTKDVVVEANRAKEEAKWESQSTTVITQEDITKKQAKSLEDIIFSETGVTRTVDAMGRVGIAIRGADPRHTLMLIDGQPVMGSESKFMGNSDEATRIGAENIDHIEIIRGAATAKYGPDAVGGVIDILNKKQNGCHP